MQTTLADALLWLLQKLSVWTLGDLLAEALLCLALVALVRIVAGVLAFFWPAFNRIVQRGKRQR